MALDQMLKNLSEDINEAYEIILRKIPESYGRWIHLVLYIILAAERPLTLEELNISLNIIGVGSESKIVSLAALESILHLNIAQVIQDYYGSILRIINKRVYLVHVTAREYLMAIGSKSQPTAFLWKHTFPSEKSNKILARIYIQYLFFFLH